LDLVARLLAAASTVVVPVDVLLLGVGEALDRVVDVREVRAEGATDAATGDPDLGEAEQAVAGLHLQQVIQRLRRSAPATGGDQAVALEALLAGGPLHDLVDVCEVGGRDGEVVAQRLTDAHHGHLLPHVLATLSSGTVGGLVEPAQAVLDDLGRAHPVEAGARGEAGALTAGEHDVLHRGRGGGVLGRLGHVAAGAGDRHADLTAGAALGGCGHGVACALVVPLVLGVLVLVVVLLVLVVVGAELAVGVLGLGGIVLVGVGGQLLLGGVLVGGADLRGQLGGAVGALTSGLLADTSLGLNGL